MKKKIFLIILLAFICISCDNNKGGNESMIKQDLVDIEKDGNGEIIKGNLEGYKFVETDKVTDRVKIQMDDGSIILMVLSNSSTPITVENFKNLVSKKFYDGLIFHRVIEDFMIQGGDPTGTGYNGSGTEIKGEFQVNGVDNTMSHTRGVVSMARGNNYDSASSQFFIVHKDSTHLDGQYAAFGKVFAGMDAVDAIASVKTDAYDRPLTEQKIKTIRFIEIEN